MREEIIYQILEVVNEIPYGKVATYEQIAKLIGKDKNARLVGSVLSHASYYGKYPCHRVVNHQGRIAPGWIEQKTLLEAEGISFKNECCVDLKRYQWKEGL